MVNKKGYEDVINIEGKMEFIKFEQKHNLGIKEIDNQHKEIYNSLNHLYEIHQKNKKEVLNEFESLLQLLKIHFQTEENFMKRHKAVEFITHKLEHERFIEKYFIYFKNFKENEPTLDTDVLLSIRNWLDIHFEKRDIKLQALVHNN